MKKFILFWLEGLSRFLFLFPRIWIRRFGYILGWLWYDVFKIRRQVIRENLDIAFPEAPDKDKRSWGRHSVYSLGAGFLEVLTIPRFKASTFDKYFDLEGEENLKAAEVLNKGVLGLSLHLGNGDLGGTALAMSGHRPVIISKSFKNQLLNSIWFHFRSGQGLKFIDAHSEKTPFEILRALKNKSLVIFVLDQFMGRPYGIETTFFGRKTGTAYGLALFYLKTRAPIVPIYTYEGEDHRLHVVCEAALELESFISSDQDKTISQLTQYFTDVLESAVKKHPKDWMWVHRRWKQFE